MTDSLLSAGPQPPRADAEPGRPLIVRIGNHLRGVFDRLIARSSLVPNDPVLDARGFAWTAALRDNWRAIRDEAVRAAMTHAPDHRDSLPSGEWTSFFLWGYGYRVDANAERCPLTTALVERIPGLTSAFFSILAPGAHIPAHRGVTKGLITCHLGLVVPRDGDVRMRVGDRVVRWSEGETLVFDDTYDHEVWNDTSGTRVVLLVQIERPLAQPGKWFADLFLGVVRRSAVVQEARVNVGRWNAAATMMDV